MANPWFRFYAETLNNPKAQKLPDDLFKIWVNLLCIACENDGVLPHLDDLTFKLRASESVVLHALQTLVVADLLAVKKNQHGETYSPKNWNERQFKSDSSNERVKRHRDRHKAVTCNVTVTPPEQNRTDTDQNRAEAEKTAPFFSEQELSQFRKQCPSLTDQEFKNQVHNCELWIKAHGSKTPELTLSKWLQRADKDKPKRPQAPDGLQKIRDAMGVQP